jgi:hypothetical protein
MDEPSTYVKSYLAVFNIGVKAFGASLAIMSVIFIVLIIKPYLGQTNQTGYPVWLLVLFIPLVPLGVLIVRAKKYYPKQYKDYYERDFSSGA